MKQNITIGKSFIVLVIGLVFLVNVSTASAHVAVRPSEVGVAAFQTFTVGVPVEKDVPTTALRLVIPEGLQHVTPNVKQGWDIEVKKEGEDESAKVTEVIWTGGTIPAGQRDEFLFSAQVPAEESTVVWKAYQTYEDGSVVAWDQDPKANHDHEEASSSAGPYSETKVVNDLANSNTAAIQERTAKESETKFPFVLSVSALALSSVALGLQLRKRGK